MTGAKGAANRPAGIAIDVSSRRCVVRHCLSLIKGTFRELPIAEAHHSIVSFLLTLLVFSYSLSSACPLQLVLRPPPNGFPLLVSSSLSLFLISVLQLL